MQNLNKNLLTLIIASLMITGCSNLFLKNDNGCHYVIETSYSQPVVSNLDYALINGFQNQAVIEPAFQHALTLPSRLLNVTSFKASTPVQSEQENLNTVYFAFDSVNLSDSEASKLNRFITKNTPLGILHIKVTGHTDSYGSSVYNQKLAKRRAQSVRNHLISKGIKSSLISMLPLGEHEPAATNSTDSGRALNRRSELYPITRK